MGKHRADNGPEVLADFLPTMVITDYVSAMTVYQALTNAANDYNRMSRQCQAAGDQTSASRWIGNADRCRNLAAQAYAEACNLADAIADGRTDLEWAADQ